ncbi:hypothetical protein K449DRAFT_427585 [Hypoxylon sp. EC38]|nr:hypothetical protein K449DRAFT_427585 [Hypoxylon sp. EC38]
MPRATVEQIRMFFKNTIHSIFFWFTTTVFRVTHFVDAANGGVPFLILISSLGVDLSNRAAMLDCAIVPLSSVIWSKFSKFFWAFILKGIPDQRVSIEELRLWKFEPESYPGQSRIMNRFYALADTVGFHRNSSIWKVRMNCRGTPCAPQSRLHSMPFSTWVDAWSVVILRNPEDWSSIVAPGARRRGTVKGVSTS